MLELDTRQIRMGQRAADKAEALRLLGAALVADGLAAPGYAEGLKAREAQGSTYLGQGIAIPHGTPDTRELVFSTGVRLLQFPEGVDWGDGQQVYLAIGIAAKSDEHLQLLQLLTRALGEADLGPALSAAASAEEVLGLLQGAPQELALDAQLVGLGQNAEDLDELAWLGARLLKKAGCVENGFAAVLQQTEPLPLGDGLCWLHSEQLVKRPGLAFVTPAQPLQHQGQPVTGLFCLASLGEAHQALLERLCDLLLEGRGAELVRATSSRSVLAALGGELPPDWPSARAVLANPHGLHARPAQALAQLAKGFAGEIRVRLADSEAAPVSAKSLSKLLALGARRGQTLEFSAEPAIAEDALPALLAAVREGLGEEVEALAEEALPDAVGEAEEDARPAPLRAGERLQAIAASPGIASGPAHVQVAQRFEFQPRGESPAHERERLLRAKRAVDEEIVGLVERSTVKAIREIFVTHREMLDDPELAEQVQLRLNRGESAEAAWSRVVEDSAAQQEALHDALLAERAADLRDLGRRVLARLCGVEAPREPEQPYILVMDEVGPSDVARLDAQRVAGILTARGGATSHSAIIARALGIPALVGAGAAVLGLEPGTALLLDGEHGWLQVAPSTEQLQQAAAERDARQQRQARADAQRLEPARTRDGHAVEVCANLGDTAGAARAVELGAEGVGLLRTEFVFMNNARAPDLATQEAEYRRVLDALDGRPLVARTLDVGGDKPLPYWPIPHEENPYLGLRGIRLTLQQPQILETQLRALFRAAGERPLRVMFPMVGSLDEWRQARDLALRLREEIPLADLQLGIMVEVPSAALLAPVLAREVDFFSVGTNDLTQYTLAIDRGHPSLSAQADGLHPAVLQLIDMTVRAAHAEGKWVGVCGELAADPLALPLLVGLGVDELSVSARSIALVKAGVRELQLVAARGLARKALGLASAAEVRALVEAEVQ
ncbi:TPA: phosphoenolpyruvate--protein phosphotransferase [Pseudomonas aeruginosa]|uniref:phosphoenolpyruvate--protein phosphotransferase n=3 Tax=Pseudomonas aeruginosa TaxID=287 RepID=UPI0011F243BB|nr:phosphoenolpyruvate--protein phosphotransferase [Pseudomonas aeruginosa]MDY1249295.1 phosphoenolpyruvate--protein phosphotransferase [Pseudomonas aeruginosa]QEK84975.1 phosphoenolpyruvate--protein phosphotransferase [Pseudomonas aeruginosa]HBN9950903.1 phosphoenolpyruvate--protein phosphotransferase [Pseudomonas aeruginosa]HBN9968633.1 phosphoenolpyruvate--protein phosphotransferase [Pseudomonas aeruginosa]HBN9977331.1 phosphoenolpyruvate--protein phosphotransferase [Pseudomonas aeruginosa]